MPSGIIMAVEVKQHGFQEFVAVEYEEFDPETFFSEFLPLVRSQNRVYRIEGDTLCMLIGVSHPIEFKAKMEGDKQLKSLECKLRIFGFKKGKWEWK